MKPFYLYLLPFLLFVYSCRPSNGTDASFEVFLDELDQSVNEFVNGQPEAFKSFWDEGDSVTLAGGLGGEIARGHDVISERLARVSAMYGEHTRSTFSTERAAVRHSGSMGYLVQHEHIRIENEETGEAITRKYRTTMVFHSTPEGWRVLHRQADLHTLEEESLQD